MNYYKNVGIVFILLLCGCQPPAKKEEFIEANPEPTIAEKNSELPAEVKKIRTAHKRNTVQDSLLDAITYVKDTLLIKQLIERGADVNKRDEHQFYPLFWAQDEYRTPEDSVMINYLLKMGAIDHNASLAPIFKLCEQGNLDSIKILVNQGLDVNARIIWYDPPEEDASCYCFTTPISASVKSGNLELVKFLMNNGAQINLDRDGVQPLSVALQERQYLIADHLILNGAVKEHTFALDAPYYNYGVNDTVYLDYLLKHNFPYSSYYGELQSPLALAAHDGNIPVLKRIIPVATIDELSSALCFSTTQQGAELLLKNGADVNSISYHFGEGGCHDFRTPLCTAVEMGSLSYVKFLVEKGADINFLDSYMEDYAKKESYLRCRINSPLTIAIQENKVDFANFLITRGANVNFMMPQLWEEKYVSPLIAAVETNNLELTQLLLANGAKVVNDSISALDYVKKSTYSVVIDALKKAK